MEATTLDLSAARFAQTPSPQQREEEEGGLGLPQNSLWWEAVEAHPPLCTPAQLQGPQRGRDTPEGHAGEGQLRGCHGPSKAPQMGNPPQILHQSTAHDAKWDPRIHSLAKDSVKTCRGGTWALPAGPNVY